MPCGSGGQAHMQCGSSGQEAHTLVAVMVKAHTLMAVMVKCTSDVAVVVKCTITLVFSRMFPDSVKKRTPCHGGGIWSSAQNINPSW